MNTGRSQAHAKPAQGSSRVVQVSEEHLEPLTQIIRQAWSPQATRESVRQARAAAAAVNPHAPGKAHPTFLFLSGDQALGHLTTIPIELQVDGHVHHAHWFKGYWVVPEHRNGPIGFFLLREAMQQLETTLSMVVQPAPRRLFHSLGLHDYGSLPNFIRILQPGRVLRRLDLAATGLAPPWLARGARLAGLPGISHTLGGAANAALKCWTLRQPNARGVTQAAPETLDQALVDALWRNARTQLSAAPVRDYRRIRQQCGNRPGLYTAVTVGNSTLAGLALVRRPRAQGDARLQGLRVATLSDLLYPPNNVETGLHLLAGAEETARQMGADALLCSASHHSLPALLRRRGYVRMPGNVHFMARPQGFALNPMQLQDWWLMRADGEADDAF